jgi:BspA type Leucine rich repeat region (6 copies)
MKLLPLVLLLALPIAVQAQDYIYITNNGTITITKYTGSGGAVTIPRTINGLPVTSIGTNAFYYKQVLINVTIPNSVTSVGSGAFKSCGSLTRVYFKGNAPSLGYDVFRNDYSVHVYCMPETTGWGDFTTWTGIPTTLWSANDQYAYTTNNGTITITGYTTGYTDSNGVVTIPDTINGLPVANIGADAFLGNGLTSITIPNSVTNIGDGAFYLCTSLTSVTIPNSVTNIGADAFNNCHSLTSVMIPNSVSSIGGGVFFNCYSLISVTIPNSVPNIGDHTFTWCASLTSVIIGTNVTSIGDYSFYSCTNLLGVYFECSAPSLGSAVFSNDPNATAYYLPGTTGWTNFTALTGLPTMLWTPQAQTGDASFGVRTNQFGFNINWASGRIVVVDACTDLANPTWLPLQTNTLTSDSCHFSDPDWTNYPGRFYRLRSP